MNKSVDTAGAMELRNMIAQRWETELPATLVFDYPSVMALAKYLEGGMRGAAALAMPATSIARLPQLLETSADAISASVVVGSAARYPGQVSGGLSAFLCRSIQ